MQTVGASIRSLVMALLMIFCFSTTSLATIALHGVIGPTFWMTGQYMWIETYRYQSEHPDPSDPLHEPLWAVVNSDGWNVDFESRVAVKITSNNSQPNPSNTISTSADFTSDQMAIVDALLDNIAHMKQAIPASQSMAQYKQADASALYNCNSFTTGYTSRWVSTNSNWTSVFSFPSSFFADWVFPNFGIEPTLAGHNGDPYAGYDHSSIVTQVYIQIVIYGQIVTLRVPYYTGKLGWSGVYRTPLDIVEKMYLSPTDHYIWNFLN